MDGRGRKPKKGKAKANDYEPSTGSKRKRGIKSLSVTPDGDDDDDDHETVSDIKGLKTHILILFFGRNDGKPRQLQTQIILDRMCRLLCVIR